MRLSDTVVVDVAKGAIPLLTSRGWEVRQGDNTIDVEQAIDMEVAMFNLWKVEGNKSAAGMARKLATAIECTRPIADVHREIALVLDNKWQDEQAVEAHIQLMVHRGWDRYWAMRAITEVKEATS